MKRFYMLAIAGILLCGSALVSGSPPGGGDATVVTHSNDFLASNAILEVPAGVPIADVAVFAATVISATHESRSCACAACASVNRYDRRDELLSTDSTGSLTRTNSETLNHRLRLAKTL